MTCLHFRAAVFVQVGSAHLCTGIVASFYMCSAVEVAWLAQNIRHNSASVRLRLVAIASNGVCL